MEQWEKELSFENMRLLKKQARVNLERVETLLWNAAGKSPKEKPAEACLEMLEIRVLMYLQKRQKPLLWSQIYRGIRVLRLAPRELKQEVLKSLLAKRKVVRSKRTRLVSLPELNEIQISVIVDEKR